MRGHCPISLAVLCVAALLPSCSVPREPVWLPNSSGFIYTTDTGSVVHYDVSKGEGRTVVEKAAAVEEKASTKIPALSPDGKQVALVRVSSVGTGSIHLRVHELANGNLLHAETLMITADQRDHRPIRDSTSGAIWSPCGKHVLFWYVNHKGGVSGGHYVARTRVIKIFESATPAVGLRAFRLSPMSDDGRGFLATRRHELSPNQETKQEYMLFVEFGGRQHSLKRTARVAALDKQFDRHFDDATAVSDRSRYERYSKNNPLVPFPHGRWKQGVAQIAVCGGRLVIDTVERYVDYEIDEELERQRQTAIRENLIYTAPIGAGKYFVRCRITDGWTTQVELFEESTAKATPLGTIDLPCLLSQPAIASPDGRRVVVTCQSEMGSAQWIVIDHAGTILATVQSP
jgi:hypothetical protein